MNEGVRDKYDLAAHVAVGKQVEREVVKDSGRVLEVAHVLEDASPEALVPRGSVELDEPAGILVDDEGSTRRGHLSGKALVGVKLDSIKAADGNIGVVVLGSAIKGLRKSGHGVVIAIKEANVLSPGDGDAVPATLPHALILLVDDDDLAGIAGLIVSKDVYAGVG